MSAAPGDQRPLGLLGTFLLGTGLASRLLIPETAGVIQSAAPVLLLQAGAAAVLLERALRGGGTFPRHLLLLFLVLLPGVFPCEALTLARGLDLATAIACGLALRDLVLHDRMRAVVLRSLVAVGLVLCLLALAQTLYQRQQVQEQHRQMIEAGGPQAGSGLHPALASDSAQAFVDSWRAGATFANPNVFAGFMLLLLPLLVACAVGLRRGRAGLLLVLPGLAGLVCAGSAGALLMLLLGSAFLLVTRAHVPKSLKRLAGLALIAGALGLVVLAVALIFDWDPPLIAEKIGTFRERIHYHLLALKLIPEMGIFGIGLEGFGPLALNLVGPGDSWSRYVHDSYLQLLLECGPFTLLALAPLSRVMTRLRLGIPDEFRPPATPLLARAFTIGTVFGAAAAAWLSPGLTLMPLDSPLADMTLVSTLTAGGLVAGALWLLRGSTPSPGVMTMAVGVGVTAFVLHNLIDFDFYCPAAAIAFAVVVAIAPGNRIRPFSRTRGLLGASAVLLLVMPCITGLLAIDRASIARNAQHEGIEAADAQPVEPALGFVVHLDRLESRLLELTRTIRAHEAESMLDRMPRLLSRRPRTRVASARYLEQRALMSRLFAPDALARIEELRTAGDLVDAEILYRKYRVRLVMKDPNARSTAEACLETAQAWNMTDAEAPFLPEIRRALLR